MNTMYNLTTDSARASPIPAVPARRRLGRRAVEGMGLSNVKLEKWATAGGRGGSIPSWEVTGFSAAMVEPTYMPLIAYPQAWSGGTNGAVTGEVVFAQIQERPISKMERETEGQDRVHGQGRSIWRSRPLRWRIAITDEELQALTPDNSRPVARAAVAVSRRAAQCARQHDS